HQLPRLVEEDDGLRIDVQLMHPDGSAGRHMVDVALGHGDQLRDKGAQQVHAPQHDELAETDPLESRKVGHHIKAEKIGMGYLRLKPEHLLLAVLDLLLEE